MPAETKPASKEEDDDSMEGAEVPAKVNGVSKDTSARLDGLAQERNALRTEVGDLRRSLEALQAKHKEEISGIKEQLEETQAGKEDAESKYEDLRERVTTIRTTLGERLKEYSVCTCCVHASLKYMLILVIGRDSRAKDRDRISPIAKHRPQIDQ